MWIFKIKSLILERNFKPQALPLHVFSHSPHDGALRSVGMRYGVPCQTLRGRRMSPDDFPYHDVLFESSYPCEDPAEVFKEML